MKASLTLSEIRQLRAKDMEKQVGNSLSLEDASREEKQFLAVAQAIYRRHKEAEWEYGLPFEQLVVELINAASFRPQNIEDVKELWLDFECFWLCREQSARQIKEEAAETTRLRDRFKHRQHNRSKKPAQQSISAVK